MIEPVLTVVFWSAMTVMVFPYLVYPVVLTILCRFSPPRGAAPSNDEQVLPEVAFVISAYNESAVIVEKLENACALDYPADRLTIYVVSDASDDGTDALVESFGALCPLPVRLFRQAERLGKTAGLNALMEGLEADIVVFSDANAMYESAALRELVRAFADERVGYVVGAALYVDAESSAASASENHYWNFELRQKAMEAAVDSVVGGDGAIYAIRRALYWPLEADDINDFVNPLQIVADGWRGDFVGSARCHERAGGSFGKEFGRKRRIVNRSFRAVRRYGARIGAANRPAFLFCLIAHKVLRWFGFPLLLVGFLASAGLAALGAGWLYVLAFAGIGGSALVTLLVWQMDRAGHSVPRLLAIPYYFYLTSIAATLGILDELRGIRHVTWQHVRSD